MLPERRRQYLEAIGIDVWVRRTRGASAALPAEAQVPARPEPGAVEPLAPAALTPAELATQWQRLLDEVRRCTLCPLHATRTQGVLGVGPKRADWLVIGEAPGAEEDRRGEPFVGAAGQLLDAMLRAIGLDRRTNVYIANVLKSRPPNNRDPKPEEVEACLPYLVRQIALLQPKIMLAVGRIAAQNLLGTDAPLGRLRGRVHHFGERQTPLVVTYHPAYLLRTPSDKRKAWEDLKFARSVYQQLTQGAADGHRS
ncbi:MAG TPA: uracil-DNA glycosylase [Steroidobacteraceae bacterium]|jgi:DNA polymerase|nr:uracil-DNA glycosylase [Steroidobacteraceae bacterium]